MMEERELTPDELRLHDESIKDNAEFYERLRRIGELKTAIAQNEAAKRVLQAAILKPRNAARQAQDITQLAKINEQLDALSAELAAMKVERSMEELQELIKEASPSWEGVDADEFMNMVRGREDE